jgi:multiple sugar transport system substrate-binding protein
MNKRISWSCCFLIFALVVAACAPAAVPPTPLAPQTPVATLVTVVHWQHHYEARAKFIQEVLIPAFEKAHPGVKIQFESIPYNAYWEKLVPSLQAGTGPDVFQIPSPMVLEFVRRDLLAPIPAGILTAEAARQAYIPWVVSNLIVDGQLWGLPTDVQVELLYVNNTLAQAAGLDLSKGPQTWEDLVAWAKAMTRIEGGQMIQAGLDLIPGAWRYYDTFPQQAMMEPVADCERQTVNYASPDGVRAWSFLRDLVRVHQVDDPNFLPGQDRFVLGKAGMTVHLSVYQRTLALQAPNLEYTIYPVPHPADRPSTTAGSSWAYVVSKRARNADAAWAWVNFLTSPESQIRWFREVGELPSRLDLLDRPEVTGAGPFASIVLQALKGAEAVDVCGWDDIYAFREDLFQKLIREDVDVAATVKTFADKEQAHIREKFAQLKK